MSCNRSSKATQLGGRVPEAFDPAHDVAEPAIHIGVISAVHLQRVSVGQRKATLPHANGHITAQRSVCSTTSRILQTFVGMACDRASGNADSADALGARLDAVYTHWLAKPWQTHGVAGGVHDAVGARVRQVASAICRSR